MGLNEYLGDRENVGNASLATEKAQSVVSIPEDLKKLYESDATWDGRLMVDFALSHGIPMPWAKEPWVCVTHKLIERIGALEKELQNAEQSFISIFNRCAGVEAKVDAQDAEASQLRSALATANAQVATWTTQAGQYRKRVGELEGENERLKSDTEVARRASVMLKDYFDKHQGRGSRAWVFENGRKEACNVLDQIARSSSEARAGKEQNGAD